MRKYFSTLLGSIVAVVGLAGFALAANGPTIVMGGHEHWTPGTGMIKGTQVAVLAGNPMASGSLYIVRIKAPAGITFVPHYHNEMENVSVISGTLWVGLGDKVNAAKLVPLAAGSFAQIPAKLHHYAVTKSPVVFDITGVGPRTMIAVKP